MFQMCRHLEKFSFFMLSDSDLKFTQSALFRAFPAMFPKRLFISKIIFSASLAFHSTSYSMQCFDVKDEVIFPSVLLPTKRTDKHLQMQITQYGWMTSKSSQNDDVTKARQSGSQATTNLFLILKDIKLQPYLILFLHQRVIFTNYSFKLDLTSQ